MQDFINILFLAAVLAILGALYLVYKQLRETKDVAYRALNKAQNRNEELDAFLKMVPEDFVEELRRHRSLMKDMNDELEKQLRDEKAWTETLDSVLNFNVNVGIGGENNNG